MQTPRKKFTDHFKELSLVTHAEHICKVGYQNKKLMINENHYHICNLGSHYIQLAKPFFISPYPTYFNQSKSTIKHTLARSFWAAKSDFCSIMQKFLHDEKIFLQPKNFCHLRQNSFFHTIFDIQSFWKVQKIGFKNFCMVRKNFCMLQKSSSLIS